MLTYLIATVVLIFFMLGYLRIAEHFNIIDKPNERSSHSYISIRGGGIIFPIAALLWFVFYGFNQPWIILSLFIVALISFLDDIITLSSKIRLGVHFVAVSLLFWQTGVFELHWFIILLVYLFTIGWINAFNFMDGINGITPLYTLTALLTFGWLNRTTNIFPQELIVLLVLSIVIFSFFNVRKRAKTFAGDVGSVSLAFLLAWFMIALMVETGRIEYILFFTLYGIDSVITIIYRLKRGENIFKAHRSHLYQLLSNELQWSHILVASIYAFFQLVINIMSVWLFSTNKMDMMVCFFLLSGIATIYLIARYIVIRQINKQTKSKVL